MYQLNSKYTTRFTKYLGLLIRIGHIFFQASNCLPSELSWLTMSFVAPSEHDEVACALATLLLSDAGVKVDSAMIEKVSDLIIADDFVGSKGYR